MKKIKVINVETGKKQIIDMPDEPTYGYVTIPVLNDIKDILELEKKNSEKE